MNLLTKLFKRERQEEPRGDLDLLQEAALEPKVRNERIPGSLDLGWYYSENKDEYQMAQIAEEDRATHLYVIGATGTGKTKFLEFLIQQDIDKGNGFGVIDPHGDLIEDIKGFLACRYHYYEDEEEIAERLVLVDPTDPEFTVTFNPLEKLPNVSVAEQANELVLAFRKIWSDSWGVRMEDLMRNSLIALGEAELTLAELPQFLTRRAFRASVLEKVEHPIAREYFQRFEALTDRAQATWTQPVMNKVNAFLSDHRIRQMFSHPKSTFNLREVMDEKKMLLVKLDKGRLKGSADLLGSLLMAKLQMAALSRSDLPQSRRTPFYFYIDEFQNFASDSFAVVLAEARKYGLCLIMAHQTLAQISPELRSLILGNTGIQVYFRVNRQDAQLLAKEGFEYDGKQVKEVWVSRSSHGHRYWSYVEEWEHYIAELQKLPPRVCYAKHKIEGGIIPFRTVDVEPAWEVLGMSESEYEEFQQSLPFGREHLLARQKLAALSRRELAPAREESGARPLPEERRIPAPPKTKVERVQEPAKREKREAATPVKRVQFELPVVQGKGGRQHRYLQSLIKRMAEEYGYRAVIEQATPDGRGQVDVGLERNGRRIACEVSVTTTAEQELSNIRKCLTAGYKRVILCSPEGKTLRKVKRLVARELDEAEREKVLFLQPEELLSYLEEEAAEPAEEERVKGYKVKVRYQPLREKEQARKREAVAKVIIQALRRLREEK